MYNRSGLKGIGAANYSFINGYMGSGTVGVSGLNSGYGNLDKTGGWLANAIAGGNYGRNTAVTSAETKQYVSDVKKFSDKLIQAADKMTSRFPPMFLQLVGTLDNSSVLDVKSVSAQTADKGKTLDVNVKQSAAAQINTGMKLTAAEKSAQTGNNTFDISVGGKTYNFGVFIGSGDNNQKAQQKVADAINKQDIGINAIVTKDEKTGQSYLTVQSKETGEKQAFSIQDKNGGIIAALGAGKVQTAARDAVYSVNGGVDITSGRNEVKLGNGITATLKEAGKVKVGLKADTESIMGGVKDFVNSYNDLMKTAKDYGSTGSSKITDQLSQAYKRYSATLASVGVTANKDGLLKVDEEKAKTAVSNGSMEKAMGAVGYTASGFTAAVRQTAGTVQNSPNQYIGIQNSGNAANDFSFFYGNNLLGSMTGIGLLFNALF